MGLGSPVIVLAMGISLFSENIKSSISLTHDQLPLHKYPVKYTHTTSTLSTTGVRVVGKTDLKSF